MCNDVLYEIAKIFVGVVVLIASYLINRMPYEVLQYSTLLEGLKFFSPKFRINSNMLLKIFGCSTYVHTPNKSRSKLDPRAVKCVFVGYDPNKKGYKFFNPLRHKFYVTMDANFLEDLPFFNKKLIKG